MIDWPTRTLGELVDEGGGFIRTGPFGSQLHQSDYVDDPNGVPVVMPKDMTHGRVDCSTIARIDRDTADRLSHHLLEEGDIVLSRRGDVGRSAWIGPEDVPVLCGTGSIRVHPGMPTAVHSEYLRYFFRSRLAIDYLEGQAVGATMPNLNAGIVTGMPVPIIPLTLQMIAAETLRSIDDLIENNRRRVEVLEEMARATYREWFVHFRYPGHEDVPLVDSPVGPIPDGWEVGVLGDLAELDRRNIQPSKCPTEAFDHYSIPAFDDGQRPAIDLGATIKSGKYLLSSPAVLVSKLNPRIDRVWLAAPVNERRSVTSTEFLILRPRKRSSLEHLYLLTRSTEFRDALTALSGGTSGSHQRAKPSDFLDLPDLMPPAGLIDQLVIAVGGQLQLIRTLRWQSVELGALRDLLLPRLVTGQIDVSHLDLDALTEAATA